MASSAIIGLVVMSLIGAGSLGTVAVMNPDWGMMDHGENVDDGSCDVQDSHDMEVECEEHGGHENHEYHEEHEEHEGDEYHPDDCCHHELHHEHHHGH